MSEKGHISIHAENILPIIKKWLYSEKEIYLREVVANASDALLKLQKLSLIGETDREIPEAKITVSIDQKAKTLTVTDTGLGMTADEVKRYINQVAFSGLQDFVAKYQDKDDSQQVIGHFGLGFYSTFMVADKVEIETLSHRSGSQAVRWTCDGSTEFTLEDVERREIGTSVILHITDDSKEMLNEDNVRRLLEKYCAFIRHPIEVGGKVVNEPRPLWTRSPTELKDKDYIDFFHKVFPITPDPIFWIHLNLDYPVNLSGVLYFPKLTHELEASQGEVKLFCNQVYVADNVKELIPEFLTLLKGVVDCPDLPLNVSRSFLQNDPTVRKISEYITKKVADKLTGLAKTDRENYEKYWKDIHPFVKFGMMRDEKFYERMAEHVIFKSSAGGHVTCQEYLEKMHDKADEGVIIYATDEVSQAGYLRMLEEQGMQAVIADSMIDAHFMPYLEMKTSRKYKFQRVDADVCKHLLDGATANLVDPKDNKTKAEKIESLFKKYLARPKVKVRVEGFKSKNVSAMLVFDENLRRLKEMSRVGPFAAFNEGKDDLFEEHTLVVNLNSDAVANLLALAQAFNREDDVKLVVNQIYDLAFLQQGQFSREMMQSFIDRANALLGRVGTLPQTGGDRQNPAAEVNPGIES